MSYELWYFSLRARLNLCSLVERRHQGQRASVCHRCNEIGSLFHISSRCKKYCTSQCTQRHDTILYRLIRVCFQGQYLPLLDSIKVESLLTSGSKSIIIKPGVTLLRECCVPLSKSLLKPDFILFNEIIRTIYIVDVTIVAESSPKAFA